MNRPHLIAALCFAVAAVFYIAGLSKDYSAGFVLVGAFFEITAWANVIRARREKKRTT
jgi:hypothetical protein